MPSHINNTLAPSGAHNAVSIRLFIDAHNATRNSERDNLSRTKRERILRRRRNPYGQNIKTVENVGT
jgi:hypothetical protein